MPNYSSSATNYSTSAPLLPWFNRSSLSANHTPPSTNHYTSTKVLPWIDRSSLPNDPKTNTATTALLPGFDRSTLPSNHTPPGTDDTSTVLSRFTRSRMSATICPDHAVRPYRPSSTNPPATYLPPFPAESGARSARHLSPETLNDINALADSTDVASDAVGSVVAEGEGGAADASSLTGVARTKRDSSLSNDLDGEPAKEIISITLNIKGYQFEPDT
uniref:Uncharacterized protein n=1 Tax=Anopheles maculatus TaxID=74869 RepID=A0A182TAY7_9DIPT